MFQDLHKAYREMLKEATHIADNDGIHVTFPQHLFERFEKEYNLCFVESDEDVEFKNWQAQKERDRDGWHDDDKWSLN